MGLHRVQLSSDSSAIQHTKVESNISTSKMAHKFAQHISFSKNLDHVKGSSPPYVKQSIGRIEGALKRAYSKYWDWVLEEKKFQSTKETKSKLQFFYEPVPGIYSCEKGSQFRKLVYVKGNQKKDLEGLFRRLEGFDVEAKKEIEQEIGPDEGFNIIEASSYDNSDASSTARGNQEDNIDRIYGSIESFTIDEAFEYKSKKSTRFYGLLSVAILPSDNIWLPLLPLEQQTQTQTQTRDSHRTSQNSARTVAVSQSIPSTPSSSRGTSPMTSTNPSISDVSIFSNVTASSSATSLPSTVNEPSKPAQITVKWPPPWTPKELHTTRVCKKISTSQGVKTIDLAGYRKLLSPLQVEYQPVVGRWMFSAEIDFRTTRACIIKPSTPNYARHPAYHGPKKYRLFALDDGKSWVVTGKWVEGRFYERRVTQEDLQRGGKKGRFFVRLEDGRMRMQGRDERERSLELVSGEKKAFLIDDEWVMEYEGVVRFLGVA